MEKDIQTEQTTLEVTGSSLIFAGLGLIGGFMLGMIVAEQQCKQKIIDERNIQMEMEASDYHWLQDENSTYAIKSDGFRKACEDSHGRIDPENC